jgi:hypothetical protein
MSALRNAVDLCTGRCFTTRTLMPLRARVAETVVPAVQEPAGVRSVTGRR